jgi:hypothetical protein
MGVIGVRCASARTNLWFHLDVAFATGNLHPSFRTDGSDRELFELLGCRYPWGGLTKTGERITMRVLAIPGVAELSARAAYFDLHVVSEAQWEDVLPRVVAIIREETGDRTATVVAYKNPHASVPQWHAPLLRRLFG